MDHHEILKILTNNKRDEEISKSDLKRDVNKSFEMNLEKVFSLLSDDLRSDIISECEKANDKISVKRKYLQTILYVLRSLVKEVLSKSDLFMSVKEHRGVKIAIEFSISLGIFPNLIPKIGVELRKKYSKMEISFEEEGIGVLQKYNRIATTIRTLVACYKEIAMRPAVLMYLGPIFAGLFQLAHAPLLKPTPGSEITEEIYQQLVSDQEEFRETLKYLLDNCCNQLGIFQELMILSVIKDAPRWLEKRSREYFKQEIIKPNGIAALMVGFCEGNYDIGAHSSQLTTLSQIIIISGKDSEYFNSICSQVLNMLKSNINHTDEIANIFINSLRVYVPEVYREKIIGVMLSTLILPQSKEQTVVRSESEVSDCIDLLYKCFLPKKDSNFKYLPVESLKVIAVPLYCIYIKILQSACLLRSKVRELLIHLLSDKDINHQLYSAFLELSESSEFGNRVSVEFGPSGGVEISNKQEEIDPVKYVAQIAGNLLELVKLNKDLSIELMYYLLKWLTDENLQLFKNLETREGLFLMFLKRAAAANILEKLVKISTVQRELTNAPEDFLRFIKSQFSEQTTKDINELQYTCLILIKVIITEGKTPNNWRHFDELSGFLNEKLKVLNMPEDLQKLIREVQDVIRRRGRTGGHFEDVNVENKRSELNEALHDLADPLLPVRAHGLMVLTRLIESADPEALASKDLIQCFFEENLKDEDSFIYLTAINGLCAMALKFPADIIQTLVQTFIHMPEKNKSGDILPENRAKLGEILVKTTKLLGEMASKYKTLLINGFLCATRDTDSMVRASSLSCLGELCKVLGFRIGNIITEVLYCVGCIIKTDKSLECRRAAVLVINLLIRGLGKDTLIELDNDLLPVYRSLKYLRDNDDDDVLRLHAQLALEELDDIVKNTVFAKPVLQKKIFLLGP